MLNICSKTAQNSVPKRDFQDKYSQTSSIKRSPSGNSPTDRLIDMIEVNHLKEVFQTVATTECNMVKMEKG